MLEIKKKKLDHKAEGQKSCRNTRSPLTNCCMSICYRGITAVVVEFLSLHRKENYKRSMHIHSTVVSLYTANVNLDNTFFASFMQTYHITFTFPKCSCALKAIP